MKKFSRREFLSNSLAPLAGFVVMGSFLSSCKSSDQSAKEQGDLKKKADPCNDLSGLTEEEKSIRTELEYVAKSPFPDKVCDNCAVWIKPEEGKECGGCEIMEGPVHPKGYCVSWLAMEE